MAPENLRPLVFGILVVVSMPIYHDVVAQFLGGEV
jgi:hypothetical protein